MRMKSAAALLAASAAAVLTLAAGPAAFAKDGGGGGGRPGGPPVTAAGTGSLGSAWTLKSMHDDAAGAQIVGEEFEINGNAGDTWAVTFADNGTTFFTGNEVATSAGITVNSSTANLAGDQTMTAHAVNQQTGEVVNGSVTLPPLSS
jgi:hypothetical protein